MKIPENFELIRRVCALYVHPLFSHAKKSVFSSFLVEKFFSYIFGMLNFQLFSIVFRNYSHKKFVSFVSVTRYHKCV